MKTATGIHVIEDLARLAIETVLGVPERRSVTFGTTL
jgi:hypothetical protein